MRYVISLSCFGEYFCDFLMVSRMGARLRYSNRLQASSLVTNLEVISGCCCATCECDACDMIRAVVRLSSNVRRVSEDMDSHDDSKFGRRASNY